MRVKLLVIPSILIIAMFLWKIPRSRHFVPRSDVVSGQSVVLPSLNTARSKGANSSISLSDGCFNALGSMEDTEDAMIRRASGILLDTASDSSLVNSYWQLADVVGDTVCMKVMVRKFRADDPDMNEVRTAMWMHWLHLHSK